MGFGSSGGSAGSGDVSYAAYLENAHTQWLTRGGAVGMNLSVVELMNAAHAGASPYAVILQTAQTYFGAVGAGQLPVNTLIAFLALNMTNIWDNFQVAMWADFDANWIDFTMAPVTLQPYADPTWITYTLPPADVVDPAYITAAVNAEAALLDNRLVSEVQPRLEAGMRDIGAVLTSAFALARGIVEDGIDDNVAKFDRDLRLQVARQDSAQDLEHGIAAGNLTMKQATLDTDRGLKFNDISLKHAVGDSDLNMKKAMFQGDFMKHSHTESTKRETIELEFERLSVALNTDFRRVHYAAYLDYTKMNTEIAGRDATWDLEVYQHGANVMAAIHGAAAVPQTNKQVGSTNVFGAVLSGAAAGAYIGSLGSPPATAAGAAIGGAVGLISTLLS